MNPVINYTNADSRYDDRDFPLSKLGGEGLSCGLGGNNHGWIQVDAGPRSEAPRALGLWREGARAGGNESRI